MSEKGVLSKSIASNISEAIIDKLGGTGYAPNEWSKNINLLGISSADIENALASITEDASSSEKGLLSLSIASDVGAMLNKKYNTSRGFKPSEVSSAVSALTVLPEKTASSAPVCVFNDGADDVPLKSCEVALPPTLDGYSSVDVVSTGKNLFNVADYSHIYTDRDGLDSYNYRYMIIQLKPNTTYTVSQNSGEYSGRPIILINNALPVGGANYFDLRKASDTKTFTTGSTGQLYIGSVNSYDDVAYARLQACKVQIEAGNTASTFEPYNGTTHTANLGRTIYGGQADIVNGTGKELCGKVVFDGSETRWSAYTAGNGYAIPLADMKRGTWYTSPLALSDPLPKVPNNDNLGVRIGVNNDGIYVVQANTIEGVTDLASFKAWLAENPLTIIYPLDVEEDFTFEPVEISSRLGDNTMWSEQGDTEVTYRADLDLYEAPSTLLGSNNTETEGNEEQEVNE